MSAETEGEAVTKITVTAATEAAQVHITVHRQAGIRIGLGIVDANTMALRMVVLRISAAVAGNIVETIAGRISMLLIAAAVALASPVFAAALGIVYTILIVITTTKIQI